MSNLQSHEQSCLHPENGEPLKKISYQVVPKPVNDPGNPLFEQYENIRTEWVKNIYKWLPGLDSDIDKLDVDDKTVIIGVTKTEGDEQAEIVAGGLRITPLQNISDSLSWEIVNMSFGSETDTIWEEMMSDESLNRAYQEGRIFDITRAFPNPKYPEEADEIMLRVFGAAAKYCNDALDESEGDYYWLFCNNRILSAFLIKHDIPFTECAEDLNDPDKWARTRLTVVDMKEAQNHIVHETPEHPSHEIIVDAMFDKQSSQF